ncbi:MAG: S8/S53 family peptidase [Pseudomonadota bacterium]
MAERWNHRHVKAELAWPMLPQRNGRIDWGTVRVAHLDTGYTEHEALGFDQSGRSRIVLTNLGQDFYDDPGSGGRDLLTDGEFLFPGHGTRSGSALSGFEPTRPFKGIAPGLPLVPLRVAPGSLITRRVARALGRAIDHVVDQKLAKIVNISLGFPLALDEGMGAAIDRAYDQGVLVVAAAGQVVDRVTYPGRHRRTICVAGIEKHRNGLDEYNPYETYSRIDAWAPANLVERANYLPGDRYGEGDGTTYATLHVTAAAAMWQRLKGREINRLYGAKSWKRIEAFRALLRASQRRLPFKSPRGNHAGKLDIFNLLSLPLPDPASLRYEDDLAEDDLV